MKFKNNGETMKIRLPEQGGYYWKTSYSGETIELPEKIGESYGFEEVKEVIELVEEVEKPAKKSKSKKRK